MSEAQDTNHVRQDRVKRVKRLKKILIVSLITAILLPTVLCIILMFKIFQLEQQVEILYEAHVRAETEVAEAVKEKLPEVMAEAETVQSEPVEMIKPAKNAQSEEQAVEAEAEEVLLDYGLLEKDTSIRKVYLTFDDGPSIYTDEILDILKEEDVKATFFVTGKEGAEYERLYKRIVEEGHTLGMHSYSHKYYELYASKENFLLDLHKLQAYLEETTGVKSVLYRFPGGSSNSVSQVPMQELMDCLAAEDIRYFDWNVSSSDASGRRLDVNAIVENCTGRITEYNRAMILMHDAADKRQTVEALPIVIDKLKTVENTVILPVTDATEVIQHIVN